METAIRKHRVAVVGLGFIGPVHIENLRRLPNVEVTGVLHSSPEASEAKAKLLGVPKFYRSYDELVKDPEIDCIHICTPNHLHYEMVKKGLEADKHIICDKPLAVTAKEGAELVELGKTKSKLVKAITFNQRYYPVLRHLKVMREKGELGEIYSIIGSYIQDWLFLNTDYNWRLETEKSGDTKAVADIGSHLLDLLEYISGLRIVEVLADFHTVHKTRRKPKGPITTFSTKEQSGPVEYEEVEIKTEDFATILLRFDNGAKGSATLSQIGAGTRNRLSFEISGSNGTISWSNENSDQFMIGKRGEWNKVGYRDPALVYPEARSLMSYPGGHNEGYGDTFKAIFTEIYKSIGTEIQPDEVPYPTFEDGLRQLILCEKIAESNSKQCWVKV